VNPFFLGTAERRLFGIHTPAAARAGRTRAAVLCQPWGTEYIYAHRSMRQLASRLSLAGFHALRFDYFGTGDSAGEECDTDLAGLKHDLVTAIETLKDLATTERVTLIGLRAGANVAASVAADSPEAIEALVLWDPILAGDPCLAGVLQELPLMGPQIDIAALPSRSLILMTQDLHTPEGFQRLQGSAGKSVPREFLPAPCPWIESASTSGVIPARVILRIEQWLG
jgi:alpha-beta hydrolase superfamily lysophospholipase